MPFRSKETLERWLTEFRSVRKDGELIHVLIQDGEDGADTGLVIVPLVNVSTEIVMEPASVGDQQWLIRFEPRAEPFELTSIELHGLAAELSAAAALCEFPERKSIAHFEEGEAI
jgi:hypothetical protein